MMKRLLITCALVAAACGGNNDDNNVANNTTANNTTVNNTTANNTTANNTTANNTTANNTTVNNTTVNNTTVNNTTPNPYGLGEDCRNLLYDQGGDGSVDATQLQELGGGPDANPTALVTDLGADGTTDWASRSTWDAEGRELTRDEDQDGDGVWDRHIEWNWAANGELASLRLDQSGVMGVLTITTMRDAEGRLLRWERDGGFDAQGVLTPADGTPDYTDTRTYNGDNVATLEIDGDGDGTPEMSVTNSFDGNGYLVEHRRDGIYDIANGTPVSAMDGTPDVIRTFTVDGMGRIGGLSQDGDVAMGNALAQSDGTADRVERNFTYDASGNITSLELDGRIAASAEPSDFEPVTVVADGTFDLYTAQYDTAGNQTRIALDEGSDASEDVVITRTFDAMGRPVLIQRDGVIDNDNVVSTPADGTVDWVETIVWHATLEQLTSRTIDADDDGTMEYEASQEFTDDGKTLYVFEDGVVSANEIIEPADGVPNTEITVTYDAMGRMVSFDAVDADPRRTATFEYGMCADFL